MATRGIQPQNDGEGSIGIPDCKWGQGCFNEVVLPEGNVLDLINQASVIEDGSITGNQIAEGSITGNNIAEGTITGNQIAEGSITEDKLASNVVVIESALQYCRHRNIVKNTSTVELTWREPDNPAAWKKTVIVKKQGGYPENESDGTVVTVNTVRNKYAKAPFIDTQENNADWYYRAFPISNNDAVSYHELNKFGFWLYGCYIDELDAVESTCVHNLPDTENYDYRPIKMMFTDNAGNNKLDWGDWEDAPFMPKPCMLSYYGGVVNYLNPNDLTRTVSDTDSKVTDLSYKANAMMEWSPVFMKVEHKYNKIYLYFSSHKIDDDYECWSAKKADGKYMSHFYLPIFEGYMHNGIRSMAGIKNQATEYSPAEYYAPTGNQTAETELKNTNDYYVKYNDASSYWLPTTWADENLIQCLGILVTGRLNMEAAIGVGSGYTVLGTSMKKGMFFGHSSSSKYAIKFFGMEHWWGGIWRRPVGLMLKPGSFEVLVKMTYSTIDGSTVNGFNTTGEGYISTGIFVPEMKDTFFTNVAGSKYGVCIPTAIERSVDTTTTAGGSSTTNFCDAGWSSAGLKQLCLGGAMAGLNGLFCFNVNNAPSVRYSGIGASITYRNYSERTDRNFWELS